MAGKKDSTNLSYSQLNAADEIFDLYCTPCGQSNKKKEADKYCLTCKEYYCVACVNNHNSFKVLSKHKLVDPQVANVSGSSSSSVKYVAVPTELCKKHPLEVINMYCAKDDEVGCSVCFSLEHNSCGDKHYVPDYVGSNLSQNQVRQVSQQLSAAIKSMNTLKKDQDKLDTNADKSKAECRKEVQKYRADINTILDQIEATTLSEIDTRHSDIKKNIGDKIQKIVEILNELVRIKSEIESDQCNDAQKFVFVKLSEFLIAQVGHLQSAESNNDHSSELSFNRNTEIMAYLLNIVTLGMLGPSTTQDTSLTTASHQKQHYTTVSQTSKKQQIQSSVPLKFSPQKQQQSISTGQQQQQQPTRTPLASGDTRDKNKVSTKQNVTKAQTQKLHKILDKSEYNVKQSDDKNSCSIWSSCMLQNGNIVLGDNNNNKLKLIDGYNYNVLSSLILTDSPRSVCEVNKGEVVVCMGDRWEIVFVSVCDDKLTSVRTLSMSHRCYHITVMGDKMYVCDTYSVNVYTLSGKCVDTIHKDKSGNTIFCNIQDITAGEDGSVFHVADWDRGVITMNTDGTVIWQYSSKILSIASGVCTDGQCVFVCGGGSNNVLQLDHDGKCMGEIGTRKDGVYGPRTVCYNRHNNTLIIGQSNNNNIIVLTLTN